MSNSYRDEITVHVPLDLDNTLNCGQTFRWNKINGEWHGVVNRQPLVLSMNTESKTIRIRSTSPEFRQQELAEGVKEYLGLNDSLGSIKASGINALKRGYAHFVKQFDEIFVPDTGIRLLRQDPWEMVVEYLLSTQMNITTIKKRIESLCELFKENKVSMDYNDYYLFPTRDQLAGIKEEDYRKLSFGYRSKWLKQLVEEMDINQLYQLKNQKLEKKLRFLTAFPGIGFKVANCVALFGFEDFRAFPVDVWISRFMEEFFSKSGNSEKLMVEGQRIFGDYCGYIQEYIFYYIRNRV